MRLSMIPLWLLTLCACLVSSDVWSQTMETVKDADLHEAFVTRISGNILIDAHPKKPPANIKEKIPEQTDSSAIWIPGYWSWDEDLNDYIWTTGVWRRPPPGRNWVKGEWKEFEDGWAWIPGFWSETEASKLTYTDLPPPETLDEEIGESPGDDYFWNPGYWWYNASNDEYEWVDGQWEELDPSWVLIPTHYIWRPEGYALIDAYWDWPVDSLGQAYEPIYVAPSHRDTIIYEPVQVVETTRIIDHYFYTYPDHTCYYYHHFHYHPYYWESYCCAPQWWLWDSWWGLSWSNQWGLWWWYSNPGYPAPIWINANVSSILPAPRPMLHRRMKRVRPPKFITPKGMVSPNAILKETQRISGRKKPIVPPNRRDRDKIWKGVRPKGNPDIRPHGRPRPFNPNVRRPSPPKPSIDREPGRRIPRAPESRVPRVPKRPEARPDVKRPGSRPDRVRPRPDGRRPESERPDTRRPGRPRPETKVPDRVRPRPDFDRPGFQRPPTRRPSRPGPDLDRPEGKRPDFDRPPTRRPTPSKPDFNRPEGRRPDGRRPEGKRPDWRRPETPKPDIRRPDRKRPEGRKPEVKKPERVRPEVSRPKPEIDRSDRRRPEHRKPRPENRRPAPTRPEIKAPSQPPVSYPPGFHGRQPEVRQPQESNRQIRRQERKENRSDARRERRKQRESRRERDSRRERRDRDNDDDD